ncbi:rfaE bifunctional protein kinase chain/domain [Brevibacterium sanguinis]|uniref:RfaE bifunctional protein kinase chain/domain n=2 Tax=Brevibacterium TaxID=1696 RepID=A0A366IIY5_9MICO|nr:MULTISPECIES: PfkB family carbohydrate kinase [Brevibacterium]RBP65446.1 rfaE bifunctional protein kinase chain/domain [Brevibacterium sanguinis]RBP72080.1 rfaE bifunctional protein kinase chain/domain [Brevibacterium celere]
MDHDPRTAPAGSAAELVTPELICELARSSPLITVIGDIILDSWMQGHSTRLAREAPVPVVEQGEETLCPGGAANTAMNLASLGARVRLLGVVGDDESGAAVRGLLADANVDVSHVLVSRELTTTKKTRIVVDEHIMLRLDAVGVHELSESERRDLDARLCTAAVAAAADSDALVIADYGGPVHATELPRALAGVEERPLTIVDAHSPEHWRDLHPTVVTPNVHEVEETLHASFRTERHRVTLAQKFAPALRAATNSSALVITLDKDGAVAVDAADTVHVTRADPVPESQASGAGDTFVAGLALALSTGCPLGVAAEFAQLAANVVVHRQGTSLCSTADLLEIVGPDHRLAEEPEPVSAGGHEGGARGRATRLPVSGNRTVLAFGPADPTADGSILEAARSLGTFLVVALPSPSTGSPALHADPRVDVVTPWSPDVAAVVASVRPDVIALDTAKPDCPRPAEIALRFSHLDIEVVDLRRHLQDHGIVKEAR